MRAAVQWFATYLSLVLREPQNRDLGLGGVMRWVIPKVWGDFARQHKKVRPSAAVKSLTPVAAPQTKTPESLLFGALRSGNAAHGTSVRPL